jgi:hypothetical protein
MTELEKGLDVRYKFGYTMSVQKMNTGGDLAGWRPVLPVVEPRLACGGGRQGRSARQASSQQLRVARAVECLLFDEPGFQRHSREAIRMAGRAEQEALPLCVVGPAATT